MADIRFYHTLHRNPLDILPDLLEKARAKQQKIVVRVAEEDIKQVDDHLWTFSPDSFLPHGLGSHGPIQLASDAGVSAPILFLMPESDETIGGDVELCCKLFDGRDDAQVAKARTSWKTMKDAGHTLTYWQQGESGKWEQKA